MTCRRCGCATSRRLCRQCEIEERAEERARTRARMDEESDDDDDESEDQVVLSDGGCEIGFSDLDRVEAERRARQAARALDQWSRMARLDLLEIVQDETPVTVLSRTESRHSSSTTPATSHQERETYHLTCRDCPFEAVANGSTARERLREARDVHRTAFDHEVVVENTGDRTPSPAPQLQTDGGLDR